MNGSPRSGPIFDAKKNAYYKYKLSIRENKWKLDELRWFRQILEVVQIL